MTALRPGRFAVPAFAAVTLLGGCGGNSVGPLDELPRELSAAELRLVEADNAFAWKIFREINNQEVPDTWN